MKIYEPENIQITEVQLEALRKFVSGRIAKDIDKCIEAVKEVILECERAELRGHTYDVSEPTPGSVVIA